MLDTDIARLVHQSQSLEQAGEMAGALEHARRAVDLARSLGDSSLLSQALVCLATVRFRLGQFQTARSLAEEALRLAEPDSSAQVEALWRLAACAAETGFLAEAETLYHQTAALAREIGHHLARLAALHSLAAAVYIRRGQFDLALAADEEAYQICSQNNLPECKTVPLITLGLCCLITGRFDRARSEVNELGQAALPGSIAQGYYFCWSALIALEEVDFQQAFRLLAQARSIAEATGEPGLNHHVLLGLSRTHRAAGDASSARDWAEEALAFVARVGYLYERGDGLIERARAVWLYGDLDAAETDLRTAIELLGGLGAAFDLARARLFLAALLYQRRHGEAEAAWCEAARSLIEGNYTFLLEQEWAVAFPLVAAHLASAKPEVRELSMTLLSYLERVPPSPLRILTLGCFEVYRKGQLIPAKAWRRQAGELFRLLLLSPDRLLDRDQVIEALWPEKSPAAATAFFHQATSALRRALEPNLPDKFPSRYLLVEEGQVTLRLPSGSEVDFEAFEEHISNKEWEAALALFRGEPFPKDRYQDWASWKREQLIQHYLRALLVVAKYRLEVGDFELALTSCQRALAEDLWQEQAVLLGMQACLGLNDRTGALRLYLNLEHCLQVEFGIAPMPELRQFYQSLLKK